MKVKISKFFKNSNRKIDVQIDPYDTWNLDHTLALIILPALIQLKECKHGIPSNLSGDEFTDQLSFDFYSETHDDSYAEGVKRWNEIMDKMIWSFQQLVSEDYDSLYHHGDPKYDFVKSNIQYPNPITGKMENTFQMVDTNPTEHWYDHVGHTLHEERIQEGLELFGKYYRALWD